MQKTHSCLIVVLALILSLSTRVLGDRVAADTLQFRAVELPTRLGVGYAVRLIDMNDDGRKDICIVDKTRILWLENPNWNAHVLIQDDAKTDNVCFAPYDIDGDGRLDFAVGADWTVNRERGGTIQWITPGRDAAAPWTLNPIGEEPTTHRMRFVDLDGDGRKELVVLPLMGQFSTPPHFQERGVRILAYEVPADPVKGPWEPRVLNDELHVTHNFWPTDLDRDGQTDLLVVSFEGVSLLERNSDGSWRTTHIGTGDQESSPNRGASEIKHGVFAGGSDYIATIEPWHGNQVVVYTRPATTRPDNGAWLWDRHVLDSQLKWGHAVWCANLDADDDEELVIGVRDDKDERDRCGLRIYDPHDSTGDNWTRSVVDPGSVAIEDLAVADLNDDGRQDIVAVGRRTHNVRIYWNETGAKP